MNEHLIAVPTSLVVECIGLMDDKGRRTDGNGYVLASEYWDALRRALIAMLPDDRQTTTARLA